MVNDVNVFNVTEAYTLKIAKVVNSTVRVF